MHLVSVTFVAGHIAFMNEARQKSTCVTSESLANASITLYRLHRRCVFPHGRELCRHVVLLSFDQVQANTVNLKVAKAQQGRLLGPPPSSRITSRTGVHVCHGPSGDSFSAGCRGSSMASMVGGGRPLLAARPAWPPNCSLRCRGCRGVGGGLAFWPDDRAALIQQNVWLQLLHFIPPHDLDFPIKLQRHEAPLWAEACNSTSARCFGCWRS